MTTERPAGHLCHRAPGRARIRFPGRRGNRPFFVGLSEQLSECNGLTGVEANPLTGSVLLLHTGELEPILEQARRRGLFMLGPNEGPPIGELVRQEFQGISEGLRKVTSGQTDLGSAVFLLLVATAIIQLLRGNILAPAATLLWYAASTVLLMANQGSRPSPDVGTKEDAPSASEA